MFILSLSTPDNKVYIFIYLMLVTNTHVILSSFVCLATFIFLFIFLYKTCNTFLSLLCLLWIVAWNLVQKMHTVQMSFVYDFVNCSLKLDIVFWVKSIVTFLSGHVLYIYLNNSKHGDGGLRWCPPCILFLIWQ